MRTVAALAVVVSHAFLLSDGSYAREPVSAIGDGRNTIGGLAVLVFFVLSGYLITRSYDLGPDPRRFITARLLRIMPGFIVVVLLAALVVGPICSTWTTLDYFGSIGPARYIFGNLTFLLRVDTLPGVFTTNPFPLAVNGSLWTLRFEVLGYALILALGMAGLLTRWVITGLMASALVVLAWLGHPHSGLEFLTDFLGGAAFYLWRAHVRPSVMLGCAALCGAALFANEFRLVSASAGAVVILSIATSRRLRLPNVTRYGDLSYGIYIYAFPIQQVVTSWIGPGHWAVNLILALPPTLICAALSWHLIEKRASRWRPGTYAWRRVLSGRKNAAAAHPAGDDSP